MYQAMEYDLLRHVMDLADRCLKSGTPATTYFLTPAEQEFLRQKFRYEECNLVWLRHGDSAERKIACLIPDYMNENDINLLDYMTALKISVTGTVSHRDILGAILATGISRDNLGDILISEHEAYIVSTKHAATHIRNELEKIGRYHATFETVNISDLPAPQIRTKEITATVQSIRLDAVAAELFQLSRSKISEMIRRGEVSLNYLVCMKNDAGVPNGSVISLRGHGKGKYLGASGNSKKGRIFIHMERYL